MSIVKAVMHIRNAALLGVSCRGGLCVLILLLLAADARSQDAVLEALLDQRQRVRTAEVLREIGVRPTPYGPLEIQVEREPYRRVAASLPMVALQPIELPPLLPRARPEPEVATAARELEDIRWERVAPGAEEAFSDRFMETLWTTISAAQTDIDTMATPEIRARLNGTFGAPTRTPVARGRPQLQAGSEFVQFEYWFVVNDSIPFVVMDRMGPFGRGLLMIGDEEQPDVLEALRDDLVRRLITHDRRMPYVDYFQSDNGQWFVTGFDGETFYVTETERPRWARRGRQTGRWYDFR